MACGLLGGYPRRKSVPRIMVDAKDRESLEHLIYALRDFFRMARLEMPSRFLLCLQASALFSVLVLLIQGCSIPPVSKPEPSRTVGDPFRVVYESYARRAGQYENRGDLQAALLCWEITHRLSPSDPRPDAAINRIERHIETEASRHYETGLKRYQKGDMRGAQSAFLSCLAYNPLHEAALTHLKSMHGNGSDFIAYETKGGETPKVIAQRVYNDPDLSFVIAYLTGIEEDRQAGPGLTLRLPALQGVLSSRARSAYPVTALKEARNYFQKGKYQEAVSAAETVLGHDPTNREAIALAQDAYYHLGTSLFRERRYEEALWALRNVPMDYKNTGEITAHIEKYLQNRAELHYKKGMTYYNAEQFEEALKEWQETLRLNPNHPKAGQDIQKLERTLKKLQ
jgi:Tetratricopeptide repeat